MSGARQLDRFAALRRIALGSALLVTALAGAGCFKPNITSGGFKCADGGVCPEGFQCDYAQGAVCVTHLSDGGAGKGGKGGGGGTGGTGGMAGQPPVSCFDAKPDCAPSDAGICDPFCQSGCAGCRDKCSVNTGGALTCNMITSSSPKGLLENCSISSEGRPEQSDNCAPGLLCLADGCGARCYQHCRSDQDCDSAGCDRLLAGGTQKACDVPYKSCVPLMGSLNTGCGTGVGTISCYVSSTHPDQTVCDCPFNAGGPNEDCQRSRDCNRGLACVGLAGGAKKCLQVCWLAMDGADCSGEPGSCHPYRGSSGQGTPNTTYGYCY